MRSRQGGVREGGKESANRTMATVGNGPMVFAPLSSLIAKETTEARAVPPSADLVTADDEEQVHSWPHHKCANKKPRRPDRAVSPTNDAKSYSR